MRKGVAFLETMYYHVPIRFLKIWADSIKTATFVKINKMETLTYGNRNKKTFSEKPWDIWSMPHRMRHDKSKHY